jgi:DNA-binding protein HU-beta
MTKAEVVNKIAKEIKIEKPDVLKTIEEFIKAVKTSLTDGENIYLRGFGTFLIKHRAEKPARIISKDKSIIVPAHGIPYFKPSRSFVNNVMKGNDI